MAGGNDGATVVECPICARRIDWDAAAPYHFGPDNQPVMLRRRPDESDHSWRDRLRTAYRPCGDVRQPGTHLLPYDYADYSPITIGMVGHSKAGKTTLLAAMIGRLCSNDPVLGRLGLRVAPLDLRVHQRYLADIVSPLTVHRRELPGTPANARVEFCDALKITNADGHSFAVTFFDLAGERLARAQDDEVRFYALADALIFVVDPETLPARPRQGSTGDASFEVALHHLEGRETPPAAGFTPVAAAVVVAKADLIRFTDRIVSDWLARGGGDEEVELATVEQESEDVYAYLSRRGADAWLRPAQRCHRSTLHFASATNGPPADGTFDGAFRQCRVLKPLLATFAMTGVLPESLLEPPTAGQPPATSEPAAGGPAR